MNITIRTTAIMLSCLMLAGCLKTRAQLKNDEYNGPGVPTATKEVQAPSQYAIDEFRQEIARLTGKIDALERARTEDRERDAKLQNDTIKKLDGRVVELERAQLEILEAVKKLQSSMPPPDQVTLVDEAKRDLDTKDFDGAVDKLNTYLKHPNGKRQEEATFLRGEAYFGRKDYQKALLDYTKFPEKYPKSRLMPQALYKIGLSFTGLDLKDDAKAFFSELVEKYPSSKEAAAAKAKLGPAKKKKKPA